MRSLQHRAARGSASSRSTGSRSPSTRARRRRCSPTSRSAATPTRGRSIAELLWPDADAERSRSALRRTLSTLRTALGDGRLRTDRLNVGLDLDDAFFDLAEFRRLAADPDAGVEELAAAAALHRGDLLAGFALRDSVDFDDWQREAQEVVRRERAALLDRLADALADAGPLDEAIAARAASGSRSTRCTSRRTAG